MSDFDEPMVPDTDDEEDDDLEFEGDLNEPERGLRSVTPYPNNPTSLTREILDKEQSKASLFERALVDSCSHYAIVHKFLNGEFVTQSFSKIPLEANVFFHGIYLLQHEGKLKLYSLESDAAMSQIQIGYKQKVHVPSRGRFVFEMDNEKVVFATYNHDTYVYFEFCANTYEVADKFIKIIETKAEENNFYKNKVFSFEGNFISLPELTLDKVVLPDDIAYEIKSNVVRFFQHTVNILEKNGLPTKRGLIFCGESGVGKSYVGRILAATLGVSFIVVTNVYSKEAIHSLYAFARKIAPVVILFEDIDIYLFDRNSGDAKLATLLNELDGMEENKKLITILTTNKIDVLDKAIKERPGRFDRILKFELPSEPLMLHMLKLFSEKFDTTEVDFNEVVQSYKGKKFSCAHLKEIVITACMAQADTVTDDAQIKLTTQNFLDAATKFVSMRDKRLGFK